MITKQQIESAAKEIRSDFKSKFVIPSEDRIVSIISKHVGLVTAAPDAPAEPNEAYCENCRSHHFLPLCEKPEYRGTDTLKLERERVRTAIVKRVREEIEALGTAALLMAEIIETMSLEEGKGVAMAICEEFVGHEQWCQRCGQGGKVHKRFSRITSAAQVTSVAQSDLARKVLETVEGQKWSVITPKSEFISDLLYEQSVKAAEEQNEMINDALAALRALLEKEGIKVDD
jgi:hypothetical protein